jgi:hypothetical protein
VGEIAIRHHSAMVGVGASKENTNDSNSDNATEGSLFSKGWKLRNVWGRVFLKEQNDLAAPRIYSAG